MEATIVKPRLDEVVVVLGLMVYEPTSVLYTSSSVPYASTDNLRGVCEQAWRGIQFVAQLGISWTDAVHYAESDPEGRSVLKRSSRPLKVLKE